MRNTERFYGTIAERTVIDGRVVRFAGNDTHTLGHVRDRLAREEIARSRFAREPGHVPGVVTVGVCRTIRNAEVRICRHYIGCGDCYHVCSCGAREA